MHIEVTIEGQYWAICIGAYDSWVELHQQLWALKLGHRVWNSIDTDEFAVSQAITPTSPDMATSESKRDLEVE